MRKNDWRLEVRKERDLSHDATPALRCYIFNRQVTNEGTKRHQQHEMRLPVTARKLTIV